METRSIKKELAIRGMKVLHFICSVALFAGCWYLYYKKMYATANHPKGEILLALVYALVLLLLERTYDAYNLGYRKLSENIYSLTLSQVIAAGALWVITCLIFMKLTNPLPLMGLAAVQFAINLCWGVLANKIYTKLNMNKRTIVLYGKESDLTRTEELTGLTTKFNVQKTVCVSGMQYSEVEKLMEGFEAVVVCGVEATVRNGIAKYCIEKGIVGFVAPHVGDVIMQGARHVRGFSVPIMTVRRAEPAIEYLFVKRAFDIIVSALGLIITSPLFLIISIAIKLCDGGSIFYKQVRLTKDNREFKILKFRSMREDAEKDGVARLSSGEKDTRITPIGRIIRACRLDELPQLINIFVGQMTIVGPRPERPEIAAQYIEFIPAFSLRLQVKAGLTGYAQVYGKYNTDPHDKLEMDLMYINKMSVIEDLRLMVATVKILFMRESTDGISEGQTTAMAKAEEAPKEIPGEAPAEGGEEA